MPIGFWEKLKKPIVSGIKTIGEWFKEPIKKVAFDIKEAIKPITPTKPITMGEVFRPSKLISEDIKLPPTGLPKFIEKPVMAVTEKLIKKIPILKKVPEKFEMIAAPIVRGIYPAKIPLEAAEKKIGKPLISTYKEMSEKHPVSTAIGGLLADIYNLVLVSTIAKPLVAGVKVADWIKTTAPYLARFVPRAAHSALTWGVKGAIDEVLDQFSAGKFSPDILATKAAKEALFGTLIAGTGVIEKTAPRIIATGIGRGGWTAIESYLADRKIDSDDLLNITANAVLGMVFEAIGAKQVTRQFKEKKIDDLTRSTLIYKVLDGFRMEGRDYLSKESYKEAAHIVDLISAMGTSLPVSTIVEMASPELSAISNLSKTEQYEFGALLADQISEQIRINKAPTEILSSTLARDNLSQLLKEIKIILPGVARKIPVGLRIKEVPEKWEEIKKLRKEGLSYEEVGKRLGYTAEKVKEIVREMWPMKKIARPEEEIKVEEIFKPEVKLLPKISEELAPEIKEGIKEDRKFVPPTDSKHPLDIAVRERFLAGENPAIEAGDYAQTIKVLKEVGVKGETIGEMTDNLAKSRELQEKLAKLVGIEKGADVGIPGAILKPAESVADFFDRFFKKEKGLLGVAPDFEDFFANMAARYEPEVKPPVEKIVKYVLPPQYEPARGKPTWKHGQILWRTLRQITGETNKFGEDLTKSKGAIIWVIDRLEGGKKKLDPLMKQYEGQRMSQKQYKKLYAMFKSRDYDIDGYRHVMANLKGIEPVITEVKPPVTMKEILKPEVKEIKKYKFGIDWTEMNKNKIKNWGAKIRKAGGKVKIVDHPGLEGAKTVRPYVPGLGCDGSTNQPINYIAQQAIERLDWNYIEIYKVAYPREKTELEWLEDIGNKIDETTKKKVKDSVIIPENTTLETIINDLDEINYHSLARQIEERLKGAGIPLKTEIKDLKPTPKTKTIEENFPEPKVPPPKPPSKEPPSPPTIPSPGDEYAFNINVEKLKTTPGGEKILRETVESIRPELEKAKGKPLTHEEVLEEANRVGMLTAGISRDIQKKQEALMHNLKRSITRLSNIIDEMGEEVPVETWTEYIRALKAYSAHATARGRSLEALKMEAKDVPVRDKYINEVIRKVEISIDEVIGAAKGVDFTDERQANTFYRKFVKPSKREYLDDFRYTNMLSNPKTNIVNALGGVFQFPVVIGTKLYSGGIDLVAHYLTGRERDHYVREVPAWVKGFINATPQAFENMREAFSGQKSVISPRVRGVSVFRIPAITKGIGWKLKFLVRAMEAFDMFFHTSFKGAESESLAYKHDRMGKEIKPVEIEEKADAEALRLIFRQKLGAEEQGHILKGIDTLTSGLYWMGNKAPATRWIIPFIQTPTQVAKQGLELSPIGLADIPGSEDKITKLGRTMFGLTVMAIATMFALEDRITWDVPSGKKEREYFYAAGKKPYSIKIGDNWISYQRIGPMAYPIAWVAAVKHYNDEKGLDDNQLEVIGKSTLGMAKFFSDQTYMQGIGDMSKAIAGNDWERVYYTTRALTNIPRQLIPFSSFQGWITRSLDHVYRDPETAWESIKTQIPFLSKTVKPHVTPTGEISKREYPTFNAISPIAVSPEDPFYNNLYEAYVRDLRARRTKREAEELAKKKKAETMEDLLLRAKFEAGIKPVAPKISAPGEWKGKKAPSEVIASPSEWRGK